VTSPDDSWPEGGQPYRTFLLRCWLEKAPTSDSLQDDASAWRCALSQLGGEQTKHGFCRLEDLVAFLVEELTSSGVRNCAPAEDQK
jgi:hypothetical protein